MYLSRLLFAFVLALPGSLAAATILDVTGANDNSEALLPDSAAGVIFTLTSVKTGVSISAVLDCARCDGTVFLTTGLGAGFNPATDIVASKALSSNPIFSGLNLAAGTYALIVSNAAGLVTWEGSSAPVVATEPGTFWNIDVTAGPLEDPIPSSSFSPRNLSGLHYTVTEGSSVPEPSTLLISAAGLIALTMRSRRLSRTNRGAFRYAESLIPARGDWLGPDRA